MTLEQRLVKEFLDDLIPRYMASGLFDGRPEMIFRQTLFLDLVQLVKTARALKPERAEEFDRLIPTAQECSDFAKEHKTTAGDNASPAPKPRKARPKAAKK